MPETAFVKFLDGQIPLILWIAANTNPPPLPVVGRSDRPVYLFVNDEGNETLRISGARTLSSALRC